MPVNRVRRPRLVTLALSAALLVISTSGCAATVSLQPADDAVDPGCAEVSVRLPDELDGQAKRLTDAQGTAAWGSPASVLLRCGVASPGPTTAECINVSGVDWIRDDTDAPRFVFTTYGREPSVEVVIDSNAASGLDVITDLSGIVTVLPQERACVGAQDVEIPTDPNAQ